MTFPADQDRPRDSDGLQTSEEPAWLWQPASGALLWGNAGALKLWGAATLPELQSLRIDRAMPAFAQLQHLQWALAADASRVQQLVIWLPTGSRTLTCLCRKITLPGSDSGLLLQVVNPGQNGAPAIRRPALPATPPPYRNGKLADDGGNVQRPHQQPELAPEDAETLAEIARLIRARNATEHSPPQDLPLNEAGPAAALDAEFFARLSHELRTPLNAIIGFAELLGSEQDGPLGSPKYRAYASHILESAAHCLSLSNDLVDRVSTGSTLRAQEFSNVDVNDTVKTCLAIMSPIAGKSGVTLLDDLEPAVPAAILDRRSVRQIVLNLISNAIKASAAGGSVTVATRYEPGAGLVLSVSDRGHGMTSETLDRARGASATPGRGLGLPLSHQLAQANGGSISIESAVGQGAEVCLRLPMARLVT